LTQTKDFFIHVMLWLHLWEMSGSASLFLSKRCQQHEEEWYQKQKLKWSILIGLR